MHQKRKVVVTGMSCLTPIGRNVKENWESALKGASAIMALPDMYGDCRIGGRLPHMNLPETSMGTQLHSLAKELAN
jgi:3-oxoacyl-(acyl-carrier-protein) synthase